MTAAAAESATLANGVKSHESHIPSTNLQNSRASSNGDLNNTSAIREVLKPERRVEFAHKSLAISDSVDDTSIRLTYRPFLLPDSIQQHDWVSKLELATATELAHNEIKDTCERIKVLVLYGSLRNR